MTALSLHLPLGHSGPQSPSSEVLIRSTGMNICLVRFSDVYTMVASWNALRKAAISSRETSE